MKIPIIAIVLLAIGSVGLQAQTPTTAATQGNVPTPTDYQIVQQDGNSRVWQREIYEQEPNGQIVARPHQFTELATGLNYKDSTGQWQPSKEEIDIQSDGTLAATQGQHQVYFPGNIYGGELELVQPDGVQLHSCPVGLSYDDGSNTMLIAVLTNSIGQLVGSNQVIYTNAFVGLDADLLYTYTKAGLEQDVVLREQPPTPASLNLNPETTRLQVLTEFLNPPQPSQTTSTLPEQAGLALTDDTLDFGAMQMVPGKAFRLGEDTPSARVGKSWVTLQGRQFLVEEVPLAALAEQLDALPAPTAQTASTAKACVISRNLVLPPQHLAKSGVQPLKLARTRISRKPGVVLDYLTVNSSLTNYTFRGDTTYYISGKNYIYGTNTFEGGAVLKYATNSSINMQASSGTLRYPTIIWKGSSYRPVIFTAKDDNSVGDAISGSTGSPSGYYANPALDVIALTALNISGFRFTYAQEALVLGQASGTPTFENGQFINCANGFNDSINSANLENVLFENVQTDFFNLEYATINVENSTFSSSSYLTTAAPGDSYQTLVPTFYNCVFANITNLTNNPNGTDLTYGVSGTYNGFYFTPLFGYVTVNDSLYPFQTMGAGKCYLTNSCVFHDAGATTGIDPALLASLTNKTTYAPIVYSNITITTNLVLGLQASRDTNNLPDLGYHYDPIDYIVDKLAITNATLTLTNGVAIATYNEGGVELQDHSSIVSIGSPFSPNWCVRYSSVQEAPVSLGGTTNYNSVTVFPSYISAMPGGQFQFSKFACPAGGGDHLYDYNTASYSNLLVQECEFWSGANNYGGTNGSVMDFRNNLYARSMISAYGSGVIAFTNNLVWGTAAIWLNPSSGVVWAAVNNDFDSSTITNSMLTNGYNAYLNCSGYLAPTNSTDLFATNGLTYQTSYFGTFYQPTNSLLIGMGSTTADLVGLYHYTVTTNQTVEGDNIVSIGYHYVATGTNGLPLSTPNDGIPDYIADANGNGIDDPGETPWDIAISSQPESINVAQGQNATFSATASGIGPFTYQWLLNGSTISGANSASYTVFVAQPTQSGHAFSMIASNTDGSVTSSNATLSVTTPPTWIGGPSSLTLVQGAAASFSVTNGGNYLAYQWYTNGVPLSNGSRISGVTTSNLTISSVLLSDAANYYVVVTNLFGSITSPPALLTVVTVPSVLSMSPSVNTNAIQSQDVQFSVSASGAQNYQWWFSNSVVDSKITNATAANYTQLVVQTNDAGFYSVVITNLAGSTNAGATMTVLVPPWITQQPVSVVTNQGSNAVFSVNATGTTNLYYQWFQNGTNAITGATNSSLTLSNVQATTAAGYSVLVTNIAGTNISAWAWLSVRLTGGGTTNGWGGGSGAPTPVPVVTMLSPTNSSPTNAAVYLYGTSISGTPISIRATASSAYSYITNVAFYFTGTNYGTNFMLAGTAVPGPDTQFALDWTNMLPGTNILKARAWDYNGNTNDSGLVYVIMAVPPSISAGPNTNIVWTEGASGTNILLTGSITNDGQPYSYVTNIQWSVTSGNGQYVTISNPNSLTTQVTFATNGIFQMQLQVNNNFATNYSYCSVTIKRHPIIYFNSPTNGSEILMGSPLVLNVTALPYDGTVTNVTYYTNSGSLGTAWLSLSNSWTYYWQNPPLWANTIYAVAAGSDGLMSTASVSVVIVPPLAVQFVSPTNGQLFVLSPTNILLTAAPVSYVGSTVTNIVFTNQTTATGLGAGILTTNGTYQLLWEEVMSGTNKLTVTAYDNFGNVTNNSITIIINAMPMVSIVTPTNTQAFLEVTNVKLSVSASDGDGTVTEVQFYTNYVSTNTLLGSLTTTNGGGLYNFTNSNLRTGVYPVIAVATDNRGAQSISPLVLFQVTPTNPYPTVAINFPTNNEEFADGSDITITATATNHPATVTNVEFFVNGNSIGSTTNVPYAISQCCWLPGTYQVMAIATDNYGSSSMSSNVQITILPEPPANEGFWDATFHTPDSGYGYLGYGTTDIPIDTCGDFANLFWPLSSAVFGSEFYLASYDEIPSGPDYYTGSLYQSDGTNWLRSGTADDGIDVTCPPDLPFGGGNDNTIGAVAVNDTGMYVGGTAISNGNYIVEQWNGTNWNQLGTNFNFGLYYNGSESRVDQCLLPRLQFIGSTLYLYGDFQYTSNTNVQFIAEWDPQASDWEPVGSPLNAPVYAVASLGGNLVVGGAFTNAAGNPNANHVAELVGGQWQNLGGGIGGVDIPVIMNVLDTTNPANVIVFSMAACNSNLFVGGDFTSAGNQTNANGIAVWNGLQWNAMGSGLLCSNLNLWSGGSPPPVFMADNTYFLNPIVYTISTHGKEVYIGGLFTDALNANGGDVPAASIARVTWDDAAQQWVWSDMDGGIYTIDSSYGYNYFQALQVNTTAIMEGPIPGPNAGDYDVIVGGDSTSESGIGNGLQGFEESTFFGVSRWRVGYPSPPGLPSVTITNPPNYLVITNNNYPPATSTNILIAATATASNPNTISIVNFYIDGVLSGNDSTQGTNSFYYDWSNPGFGAHIITAAAIDNTGLAASSTPVVINVIDPSNTISAVNAQYNIPADGPAVVLPVLTNDTPATGLTISGVIQPNKNYGIIGISYNQLYLTYTPIPGKCGTDIFYYTITNTAGKVASATVTVNILTAPTINSPFDQSVFPAPVAPLVVSGTVGNGGNGSSVTNITLLTASTSVVQANNQTPVNGTFSFNWTNSLPGFYTFTAVASLGNGFTNPSAPVTIALTNSSAPDVLTAVISNLIAADGSIGYFSSQTDPVITNGNFELYGRAADSIATNPVSYQVLLYQPDPDVAGATPDLNGQAVLYESSTPFANVTPGPLNAQGFHIGGDNNGDLGSLNLTAVPNGIYELILNVRGGGYQTNCLVEVQLDSQLKIGQFSFSQQDLVLPVNGVPITVTRTYNSLNQNTADFGYSWTYTLNSMNVQLDETRQNVVVGGNQDAFSSGPPGTYSVRTGGGYDVTLTLPNGQPATFAFSLGSGPDYDSESAQWTAPPWVHATLEPLDANGNINPAADSIYFVYNPPVWGNVGTEEGTSAPLENQDLPGWVLTTQPDGTEYFITRGSPTNIIYPNPINGDLAISATVYGPPMLTKIVERSGDTIVISPNSIYHQDTNGINRVVNFTRDAWGRITAVSDPDGGTNGFPAIQYIYNQATSNLIQVLKLVDRNAGTYTTNLYDYNNPSFPHYITSVENGDGVSVARNYYDSSGRLSSVQDAYGNLTQYIYSSTNSEMIVDPLERTNSFVYDGNGNVLIKTNALNQVTTMAYDVNNNETNEVTYTNGVPYATNSYVYSLTLNLPLSETDPLGHTTTFVYDSFGDLCTNIDAMNHGTTNIYDSNGNLISTSDALGDTTTNIYNGTLLASSSDPIGTTTYNSYDTSEDLTGTATVDASNKILSTNSYTYDGNGNRLTSTVWRHVNGIWTPATTTNVYDAQNRVIQTIDPDGGTNTTIYNAIGKQQATIDPLGHTNSYVYDDQGRLIQTIYADGTTNSSAYDAVGNRTNSVDQDGNVTTYQYDALNRLTNTIYADNTTSSTVYDSVGRVAQTIDARGTVTAFAYDQAGRQLAVTNAFGISGIQNVSSYSYDNNGNQITFTDPNNHTTTNVFDALNRQVQVKYPDGTTTFTVFDADGRSVIQTNQDRLATWFGYDGAGRLIAVTNVLNQVTRYQYDEAGNQTNQIDALNRTNIYAYDGMGRRISHTLPGGQIEGFAYDVAGNQIYQTNFNGAIITNQYNVVNRLTNCSSISGYHVSFAYSPTGQRTNMVDASGTTAYAYDVRDRLLLKTNSWNNGPGISLNYRYDANGNVTNLWSSTVNGVNLAYSYDPLNRLTNVLANGNAAAGYGFDLAGNLQVMRYGNGVTNLYQYDSLNRLTNLTWKLNASSLANFTYLLGATGNRTNLTESVNGTNRVYAWQYDSLYRLTNENFNASSNLAYSYDPVGNRTNRTSSVGSLTNQNFTFNTNDWLTSDHYDNNGNTTNSSGNAYQYDVMCHLTNLNGTVFMTYDGDGNRVSKAVGGTNTFYLLDDRNPSGYTQVLEEWTVTATATNVSKVYNYGLNLISQRAPGSSTNYFVYDGHGSTRLLVDIGGNVQNLFAYDAYGTLIASNAAPQTMYLYCGQQFDQNLGLNYNRARYLNAGTGRFWTADTTDGNNEDPLSLHKYLYGGDNPVDNDDPSGEDFESLDVGDILSSFDAFPNLVTVKQALVPIEKAQIVVTTEIRPGGPKPGVKTKQGVVVSSQGKLVSNFGFVGVTATKYIVDTGVGSFDQGAGGDNPDDVTVYMGAKAHSAFLPPVLSIRYEFEVDLNFVTHKGHLSGYHRQFPSYNVQVNGKQIYDFQQKHFLGLTGIGEVEPNVDFPF